MACDLFRGQEYRGQGQTMINEGEGERDRRWGLDWRGGDERGGKGNVFGDEPDVGE